MPDITIIGLKEPEIVKDPEPVSAPVEEQVVRAAVEQVMGLEDSGDKNRYSHKVDT